MESAMLMQKTFTDPGSRFF